MKRFVLVGPLLVFGGTDDGDEVHEFKEAVVLHAGWGGRYNSRRRELPDLYSLRKESSSSSLPMRVDGCSSISASPLLDCERNWLNSDAKLIISKI